MRSELEDELAQRRAEPFPESVEKGLSAAAGLTLFWSALTSSDLANRADFLDSI